MKIGVVDEGACCDESDIGLVDSKELPLLDIGIRQNEQRTINPIARINSRIKSILRLTLRSSAFSSSDRGS